MTVTDQSVQTNEHAPGPHDDPASAAADRLIEIVNDGALVLLASIGHETGLLDTLGVLPPSTSQQIADAAGLNERYVREWLGGLVTGGLVSYDPAMKTYALREEFIPLLTGPSVDNLARTMRMLTMLSQSWIRVSECFRSGGGLQYDEYPGFHAAMAEESAAVNDASLVDVIIPLTGLVDRLGEGIDVADVGCGSGHAINLLARAFPRSRFTGYDFEAEAIGTARQEAAEWGLTNANFLLADVAQLHAPAAFDLVTAFDAIHDQAKPATVLSAINSAIRPGGTFLMVDIKASSNLENNLDLPWASMLYAVSTTHCMSVSLGQGGDGLGTCWGVELAEQMLRDAGFTTVDVKDLEEDPFNVYVVARK